MLSHLIDFQSCFWDTWQNSNISQLSRKRKKNKRGTELIEMTERKSESDNSLDLIGSGSVLENLNYDRWLT